MIPTAANGRTVTHLAGPPHPSEGESMTFSLFPKATRFYDLLQEQNRRMTAAVALLDGLLGDFTDVPAKCKRISEIEDEGDAISREISRQLALTFLTPIDREDIHDVNQVQEGVLDLARVIATRMLLYGFTHVREPAKESVQALARLAGLVGRMLTRVIEHKEVRELSIEIRQLKQDSEARLESGLVELYETRGGEEDGLFDVIRWTQIYDRIGQAMHLAAALADILEEMSLKYA